MAASNRGFWTVLAGCLAVLTLLGAAAAYSVHSAGMIAVDVHVKGPGGCDVSGIRVPAALGHLALAFVPTSIFGFCGDEEVARHMPLVTEACRQLQDFPDFVLIEVISRDEHVLIHKAQKAFIIDVETDEETVHVSIPLGIARAFARKLERIAAAAA